MIVIVYEIPDLYYVQADRPIEQRLDVLDRTVQHERSCGPKSTHSAQGWLALENECLSPFSPAPVYRTEL